MFANHFGLARFNRSFTVYFIAGFFSILLSLYLCHTADVINSDGVCYLFSAKAMAQGLHAGVGLCDQAKWPFYSFLIFNVAKWWHLDLATAAYILNALFTLISVVTFIAIVNFFSQQPRVLWLAAIVILFAHQFNSVRDNIIRDHGFWAFYLLSIFFLLKYARFNQFRFALAWNISLVAAALFRIEAAVFLLFIPFITFLDVRHTFLARLKSYASLNSLTVLLVIGLLIWKMAHPDLNLTRVNELLFQFKDSWSAVSAQFLHHSHSLGKQVLSVEGARDANWVLAIVIINWVFIQVILNVSLIYAALFLYTCKKRLLPGSFSQRILWAYIIINLIILFAFFMQHWFFSKRYLMALSLVLMIWVPFALNALYEKIRPRYVNALVVVMMLVSLGGIVNFGYSKQFIRDAGQWMSAAIPSSANIYTNDTRVLYYADLVKQKNFINTAPVDINQYDYLVLCVFHHDDEMTQWVHDHFRKEPLKQFANARGDKVLIFKVQDERG